MTATAAKEDLFEALSEQPFRMLEAQGALIVERTRRGDTVDAKRVLRIASDLVKESASKEGVWLVGRGEDVELSFNPRIVGDLTIDDASSIWVVVFSPKVGRSMGRWRRGRELRNGLWIVDAFKESPRSDETYG